MSKDFRIIFFGPPGSGKGTQSEQLEKKFNLIHISTGDLLRAEVAAGSPVGLKAKAIMEAGGLVDEKIVYEIVENKIKSIPAGQGFIFDGFPRTISQAVYLQGLLEKLGRPATHVLYLNVSHDELKKRICGRLFHPGSGRTYHKVFNPPKKELTDDATGEPLIIRKDDTEEVFEERMRQYNSTFEPVLDHYKKSGVLKEFAGDGKNASEVAQEILAVFEDAGQGGIWNCFFI